MSLPFAYLPTGLQYSRSPIFVTVTKGNQSLDELTSATVTLAIYTGTSVGAGVVDYTLTKTAVNDECVFEISDLIREALVPDFSANDITIPTASVTGETTWCEITVHTYYVDQSVNGSGYVVSNYDTLVVDGYRDYDEIADVVKYQNGIVISQTLTAEAKMVAQRTFSVSATGEQSMPLYYDSTTDLSAYMVTIEGVDYFYNLTDTFPTGNTSPLSTQKVIYIPMGVPNVSTLTGATPTDDYQITTVEDAAIEAMISRIKADGGTLENGACLVRGCEGLGAAIGTEYDIEILCEQKYTPKLVAFINKWGVVDYLTFFKASQRSGSFSRLAYMPQLNVNNATSQDFSKGQYKDFLVNSTETITLNTGWVNQNYDEVIREFLMTETAVIYEEGVAIAIKPLNSEVTYKTSVNDSLINYTIQVQLALNVVNNAR
jgi:hypothetical protein